MKKGRFVSIEGIEGAGKTTILKTLHERLQTLGIDCVLTREPGGTPVAEAIRRVLLDHYEESMSVDTELLLMFAGRAQNIAHVILPALARGQWVLSDRFTDASFAYQGGGRGISTTHIHELANWVQGSLRPDITILLDVPAAVGLARVTSRGAKDRIETEGVAFFERVRQTYLQLAKQHWERFRVVRSDRELSAVQQEALAILQSLVKKIK
ncbi:MAG: dTMP kinase [Coxiella sp. RIFCSPHIGHO2_12_FULL_44_14]|nr:MAG: dTMP kinase [Coxiella sp. RIFCSPHIGHO2_12_FULL_44_14]